MRLFTKTMWVSFLATALFVSATGLGQTDPNAVALTTAEYVAKILSVKGKVQYSQEGVTWQPAKVAAQLSKEAQVRTGFGSTCELSFGENSTLEVAALSSVKMADYASGNGQERARANLQYGAVRCGVSKGQIKSNTSIVTPVSTLSIRGTIVTVEFDAGTRQLMMRVDMDGPAIASLPLAALPGGQPGPSMQFVAEAAEAVGKVYELQEGMQTNGTLDSYLNLTMLERTSWGSGNYALGDITQLEKDAIVYQAGGVSLNPAGGALQYGQTPSSFSGFHRPDDDDDDSGGCPWGPCD